MVFAGRTMAGLARQSVQAAHFVCKLRGGSQPILVEGTNGLHYVLKFMNNPQGLNVLFNEAAGVELFGAHGLPVPRWEPVTVTDSFIDRNRECWIESPEGSLRPQAGLCFASAFLASAGKRLLGILPGTSFGRVRNRS